MYVHLMSLLAVSSPSAVAPFPQHPSAQRAPPLQSRSSVPLLKHVERCPSVFPKRFPPRPRWAQATSFFLTKLLLKFTPIIVPPSSRPRTDNIIVPGTNPNWANLQ